jgi:ATP-dependent Lhr-like helicase
VADGAGSEFTALDAEFAARGWTPFEFQREAWRARLAGHSGLVHSATGTGKTLAALGGALLYAQRTPAPAAAIRVLWITPLRALGQDLAQNLAAFLAGAAPGWRVAIRTGDTSSGERARQQRRPPELLITTPESLAVLLSQVGGGERLRAVETIVVDEWHELLGTKRGVQLELLLARLRGLNPGLATWGLSATLGNLPVAMATLLGRSARDGASARLICGDLDKRFAIDSVLPRNPDRFPWSGHLGLQQVGAVLPALEQARSSLLFTNTRSQAELWFQALLDARPDWLMELALHHGSIDRELRADIERRLREGRLRCVVCTSSLDLGVDFSPVDQVIQVGSPKGVGRLLQRAGRSGHAPGGVSRVLCVPTTALELLEIAAARRAAVAGRVEARLPLTNSLAVLAQHLVTLACGDGFEPAALLEEVRGAAAFADLDEADWRWTLDFVTRGGPALQAYPQFQRVQLEDGRARVADAGLARRHRLAIGTISSDTAMQLRWVTGGALGTIEESFVARLRPGEVFVFAGRRLALARIRDMVAYVRKADSRVGRVPRWQGGRMPLSTELADGVVELLDAVAQGAPVPEAEIAAIAGMLELQSRWSALPRRDELLVERLRTRDGEHLFLFPFAGRLAHEGLAVLLAHRLAAREPRTITVSVNDYGIELLADRSLPADESTLRELLSGDSLLGDLKAALNVSELARRQFRDIARIAGLVQAGLPGGRGTSLRQLQASSGLVYDVLTTHDADNRLLRQAREEVLEQQLEYRRLAGVLDRLAARRLRVTRPPRLTPLSFALWAERLQAHTLSSETFRERVRRMVAQLEKAADDS